MKGAVWHHLTQELKMPGVVDVHLPESGGSAAALWLSAKKPHQSFPLQLAMAVWSKFGFYHFKWIVVTDEDVNIRDAFAREWTLAFRVQARKRYSCHSGSGRDDSRPVGYRRILICHRATEPVVKLFIDATKKYVGFPEIAIPDGPSLSSKQLRNGKSTVWGRSTQIGKRYLSSVLSKEFATKFNRHSSRPGNS